MRQDGRSRVLEESRRFGHQAAAPPPPRQQRRLHVLPHGQALKRGRDLERPADPLPPDLVWWHSIDPLATEQDLSIKFATPLNSRKVVQINRNPEVHLACGASLVDSLAPYLQVQGKAQIGRDANMRRQTWSSALKKYFAGPDDANYGVGIIEPYRIEYLSVPGPPEVWEPAKK